MSSPAVCARCGRPLAPSDARCVSCGADAEAVPPVGREPGVYFLVAANVVCAVVALIPVLTTRPFTCGSYIGVVLSLALATAAVGLWRMEAWGWVTSVVCYVLLLVVTGLWLVTLSATPEDERRTVVTVAAALSMLFYGAPMVLLIRGRDRYL